jgi:hypothetical protein
MQNTLSVAIITSALLAATFFTGQTAKAQATSLGVSPEQVGKTVTNNMTQATSNSDVEAELNLGKELVCGSAAVLNGPYGLLVGSVCNSLVAKLNSTSQQQSQPSFMNSPSKGTQTSSPKISSSTSQPSFINSPSKGTQTSSSKKSSSTSQPSFINSPSKGTQTSSSKKSSSTSQPSFINSPSKGKQTSCSDGSCNNQQNQQQQQTQQCPGLGSIIPAEETCPSTGSHENNNSSSPPPSDNNPQTPSGNGGTSSEGSSNNGGNSNNGGGDNSNSDNNPSPPS